MVSEPLYTWFSKNCWYICCIAIFGLVSVNFMKIEIEQLYAFRVEIVEQWWILLIQYVCHDVKLHNMIRCHIFILCFLIQQNWIEYVHASQFLLLLMMDSYCCIVICGFKVKFYELHVSNAIVGPFNLLFCLIDHYACSSRKEVLNSCF